MVGKRTRNEMGSLFYTILVVAILVLVNLIGVKKFGRLDLTQNKAYTLSESTKFLMRNLPDQLLVKVYFTPNLPPPFSLNERYLRDLISDYAAYSGGRLRYEYMDPGTSEAIKTEARNYGIQELEVTRIESDELGRQLAFMGLAILYRDKMEAIPVVDSVENLEYEITAAVKRLISVDKKRIGFVEAYGGGDQQSGLMPLKEQLGKSYSPQVVDLAEKHEIDPNIDLLVLAGPKETIPDLDLWAIDQFLMRGKPVLFFAPRVLPNLQNFQGQPIESGLEKLLGA